MKLEQLKRIEGKQTAESVAEELGITRNSALNLLSSLRKQNIVRSSGGGKQKRIYTIYTRFQKKKEFDGMFDILNKYAPQKINPFFIHEPHSRYGVENAIVDLIELNDLRILINVLPLFNHVTDWVLLYNLAKMRRVRRIVGALYDVAKTTKKVRKMPKKIRNLFLKSPKENDLQGSLNEFQEIEKLWLVKIPFNKKDLDVYKI